MNDKLDHLPESFIDRMRRSSAEQSSSPREPLSDLLGFDVRSEARAVEGADQIGRASKDDGSGVGLTAGAGDESDTGGDSARYEGRDSEGDTGRDAGPGSGVDAGRDSGSEIDKDAGNAEAPEPRMPAEARHVLISLMRQGVVLASKKAKVFEALVRHEAPIREHLAEVYLQLVLDERAGVAFVASYASEHGQGTNAEDDLLEDPDEDPDGASLISRRTLSLYDTLLLLVLRKHYQDREVAGEQRIIIDSERVEAALIPFLPLTNSERSDRRKLGSALTRMVEKRLLTRVRGSDERFEITPVIRYVVSAEFLESLLQEYVRLAGKESGIEAENDTGTMGLEPHEMMGSDHLNSDLAVSSAGRSGSDLIDQDRSKSMESSLRQDSAPLDLPVAGPIQSSLLETDERGPK